MFNSRSIFLVFLLIIISVISVSCTPCNDGYKQFSTEKGIAHFSFEYPCNWRITTAEIGRQFNDMKYTNITIKAPRLQLGDKSTLSTVLLISFTTPSDKVPDASTLLEDRLSSWKKIHKNFELLERSFVELDGVPGEQIKYSFRTATDISTGGNEPRINRDMFFNYNGLIIDISTSSHEEVVEEHAVYIQHLLDSFKFLD